MTATGYVLGQLESPPGEPDNTHPKVALGQARAEDLRRPLTLDALAASWGLTVDQLLDGLTPEEKAVMPDVFKARNVRASLATLRDPYGNPATSDVVRACLADLAQTHLVSARLQAKADRDRDEMLRCSCCGQVEGTTGTRSIGPGLSGSVCDRCAIAIAAVLDERARKDKQRLGQATVWLDTHAG